MSENSGSEGSMSRYALTVAVVASTLTSPMYAQTRPTMDLESLEVVPGVLVVVEGVTPEATADGLSADALRMEMESALARADISVLTEREWSDLIGNPALQLTFHLIKPSPHLYLYAATLELRQLTTLVRDSSKGAWTRTWSAGTLLGTTPTGNIARLQGEVQTLVGRFVEAYDRAVRRPRGPIHLPDRRRIIVASR